MERNPNRYDKKWDVRINERFIFDVKSTVIPREFRDDWMSVVAFPARIVNFYYDKQSRGVRYDMQNRLFIVHHSLVDSSREFLLRYAWRTKEYVYRTFVENIESITLDSYAGCDVAVIFIIETTRNCLQYKISGFNADLCSINPFL